MKLFKNIFFAGLLVSLFNALAFSQEQTYTREKEWAAEINAFREIDKKQTPPEHAILFVGSSSIRMWSSLRTDFPDLRVINRGFGGSRLDDLVHFSLVIVAPYRPKQIVVYSGENDIEAGRTAEEALLDLKRFIAFRDKELPGTPIVYISMKPSILRWKLWPEMKRGNELFRAECGMHKKVTFVDLASKMLMADGTPDPSLFGPDKLHMNSNGYSLWTKNLRPYLKK